MNKFVFVLPFLLISISALPLNETNDDENVNKSTINLYVNDTNGLRKKRDTIKYELFVIERSRIIYTFNRTTFELMKKFYDNASKEADPTADFRQKMYDNIYMSSYTTRDCDKHCVYLSQLSNVIYHRFGFIREDIDKTAKTWYTIKTEVTSDPNFSIDELDFEFYYPDKDDKLKAGRKSITEELR